MRVGDFGQLLPAKPLSILKHHAPSFTATAFLSPKPKRGLSVRTCESSDADTDPNCASNVATTYVETLETNARGNVVKEQRGGIAALQVTRTYDDLTGALLRTCAGNNCQIADENLQWDTVGNLQSRDIANKYREEYSYDSLNRLTQSRFARLEGTTYASGSQPISSQQTYDALGNLCSKTVLGYDNIYSYGGASGCGLNGTSGSGQNNLVVSPHAVQLVTNVNSATDTIYSYDSHGNQIFSDYTAAGGDRSIQYTANDQAYQITQGKNVTQFWYAPNNQRYKRVDIFTSTNGNIDPPPPTGPAFAVSPQMSLFSASGLAAPVVAAAAPPGTSQTTRTITIANLEIITAPNGVVTKRRTVAGVMLQETVSNVTVNRYLFHNHLGSVMRIAEDNGNVTWSFDYSPFGERRMPTAYNPNGIGFASTATNRGYTGHEMLDSFSIVHMNGRIYDSALGRFLQADPMVEDPSNGQNFNRYTYVWNNPLAYTDPSGFMSFKQFFRQLVGVFIASYLPGASFWGAAANGALANISSGFIGGVVATGNLRGGLAGAFSSGVMYAGNNRAPMEEAVVPATSNDSYVRAEDTTLSNKVGSSTITDANKQKALTLVDSHSFKARKELADLHIRWVINSMKGMDLFATQDDAARFFRRKFADMGFYLGLEFGANIIRDDFGRGYYIDNFTRSKSAREDGIGASVDISGGAGIVGDMHTHPNMFHPDPGFSFGDLSSADGRGDLLLTSQQKGLVAGQESFRSYVFYRTGIIARVFDYKSYDAAGAPGLDHVYYDQDTYAPVFK